MKKYLPILETDVEKAAQKIVRRYTGTGFAKLRQLKIILVNTVLRHDILLISKFY